MVLYPYQARVKELLLAGRSVILQAPTGSGKTRAALAPYIEAFFDLPADRFPRKCIYSVPMRVLANQFFDEHDKYAQKYRRRFQRSLAVQVQTGEQQKDPRFLGNLIFATIDQTLSSALTVPYSLSPRMANLNAGAFYTSYLVFDEFHLFPSGGEDGIDGALVTTLQLLMRLKGVVPFILMTATFSSTMLARLADLLDAEIVTVPPDEYRLIASGQGQIPRSRRFTVHDAPLSADAILQTHRRRSIAICNQVARAQALYRELCDQTHGMNIEVVLLHSRFTAQDRAAKEKLVRAAFGPDSDADRNIILVATQVVEVGLNITSEHLHTEIAPANAVLQRAGRCARYPGEQGHVHIYRVPPRPDDLGRDPQGAPKPDYMPYPAALCERSWESLLARSGQTIDFEEEQRIVDEVHTDADRILLDAMERQGGLVWNDILAALENQDTSQRRRLIRRIDSITVLVAPEPSAAGNPFTAEGFSLYRGSVMRIHRELQGYTLPATPDDLTPAWYMAYPIVEERNPDDPTSQLQVSWHEVSNPSLLAATPVVVINSAFCAYNSDLGFRIVPPDESNGWRSTPGAFALGNNRPGFGYRLESYEDHIGQMVEIYRQSFSEDYAYIEKRLVACSLIPEGGLRQAIRLAIACHDVAKMDMRWQEWVRRYQAAIGEPITDDDYMAVHTHFSPYSDQHRQAKQATDRRVSRPPHAGESAVAVAKIVAECFRGTPALPRAVCTAIARHHSASTAEFKDFTLHRAARPALEGALKLAGVVVSAESLLTKQQGRSLEPVLIGPYYEQHLLYLLIVRILRLCDSLSQESDIGE